MLQLAKITTYVLIDEDSVNSAEEIASGIREMTRDAFDGALVVPTSNVETVDTQYEDFLDEKFEDSRLNCMDCTADECEAYF